MNRPADDTHTKQRDTKSSIKTDGNNNMLILVQVWVCDPWHPPPRDVYDCLRFLVGIRRELIGGNVTLVHV